MADRHEIVRDGVVDRISGCECQLVAETGDGMDLVQLAEAHGPDLIVTEVDLSGCDGLSATKQIMRRGRARGIVIFSYHSDPALEALARSVGATGFVPKAAPVSELDLALRRALRGEKHFRSGEVVADAPDLAGLLELSEHERQILLLLQAGMRGDKIAERLNLSPSTIPRYVERAIEKLQVGSRTEAVALVVRYPFLGS